jgi:hypothetical protein
MKRTEQALSENAAQRLREFLGREPTVGEIKDLRTAEQALGFERPAFAKARQLVATSKALRQLRNRLLAELREKRRKLRRMRRKKRP